MDTVSQSISPEQLAATVGGPDTPVVLDVRREERFLESGRMLAGARRCPPGEIARFAASGIAGQVVVDCVHGLEIGEQAAALPVYDALYAWCRSEGRSV